jgi:single-strand DNA-binding protein
VRLIGFVGSDAKLKTTKTQREYAVLSRATTASWKDKNGDGYIRRTEWHKLVAWGNVSLFAATLKKGAHVSVEGELRYREFAPKKQKKSRNGDQKIRVAEIHLSKIAKLDRAEKRDPDTPVPELGPETQEPPFEGVSRSPHLGHRSW